MKNIVICCDGTGNEFGRNNTNVVLTYMLAEKDEQQVAYYDPGVGTGGWEYEEDKGGLRAKGDQATGHGLQRNVEDAYRYLMGRYVPGDGVYLFGFSRGAFTVRSLAGMLHKCGLLWADAENLVEYASKLYNSTNVDAVAREFRAAFGRPCPVHFIGVWDTVESLVMNAGKRFHDASLNPEVANGYHALAIDEVRRDFPPCLWDEPAADGQTIEQVWFAGVHADIGGWYDERGLSNLTLHWMLEKASSCGLHVNHDKLAEYKPNPCDVAQKSYDGFWKLRGRKTRKIPPQAKIHTSVFERMEYKASDYHPVDLPEKGVIVE
ncbi:MAG: DUF2235 domain-containing protein [Gammaproteobacteria bacterium]|nr:DUF2235 domain-containing protein [Gammaproteobacteria bacterium]